MTPEWHPRDAHHPQGTYTVEWRHPVAAAQRADQLARPEIRTPNLLFGVGSAGHFSLCRIPLRHNGNQLWTVPVIWGRFALFCVGKVW
jgi:hypothetical protein